MSIEDFEIRTQKMTKEKVLHWLLDFGRDWVGLNRISGSWADHELYWHQCFLDGYLEYKDWFSDGEAYRLTDKAMKLLEDGDGPHDE